MQTLQERTQSAFPELRQQVDKLEHGDRVKGSSQPPKERDTSSQSYNCDGYGHIVRWCRKPIRDSRQKREGQAPPRSHGPPKVHEKPLNM